MSSETLQYRQLQASEIRLIQLHSKSINKSGFSVSMRYVSRKEEPKYTALSYAWGDSTETKPIQVNSSIFHATENLYHALVYMTKTFHGTDRLFWVDAVCLNQHDLNEKAEQVPEMGNIFSSAQQVIVWLGEDAVGNDSFVRVLGQIFTEQRMSQDRSDGKCITTSKSDKPILYPEETVASVLKAVSNSRIDSLVGDLVNVFRSPWWYRLWCFQEFVLSRLEPMFMPGAFDLPSLIETSLLLREQRVGVVAHHKLPMLSVDNVTTKCVTTALQLSEARASENKNRKSSTAKRLSQLIRMTGDRKAKLPHDYIYGILGMVEASELPTELRPDYSKPFEVVFQAYAKYILENAGDLEILCNLGGKLDGYPSWIPDFRTAAVAPTVPSLDLDCAQSKASVSMDGQTLSVLGKMLGVMLTAYAPEQLPLSDFRQFDNRILHKVCQLRGTEPHHIVQDLRDRHADAIGLSGLFDNDSSKFSSLTEMFIACLINNSTLSELESASTQEHSISRVRVINNTNRIFLQDIERHGYCVADNGQIFHCENPKIPIAPGDQLWGFEGTLFPILLRPKGDGHELVTVLVAMTGECDWAKMIEESEMPQEVHLK